MDTGRLEPLGGAVARKGDSEPGCNDAGAEPRPARWIGRLLLGVVGLFALLVGLRLHGFSLPRWRAFMDGSAAPEVLLGSPSPWRWDDYAIQIPFCMSQRAHSPRFPVENENVGLGQSALVPFSLPVLHIAALFRPTTWGFFVGDDIGMSWHWWLQSLGLFSVWLLVLHRVLGARAGLALGAAALLIAAPCTQFWSFNFAPVASYMGLCCLAAVGVLQARSKARILGSGALLGWSATSALLTLYPPYLLSIGALVALLVLSSLRARERRCALRAHWRVRLGSLALAAGILLTVALVVHADAGQAIERMRHTEYPGQRLSTGGDRPFWAHLSANLALSSAVEEEVWGTLGNICEASSGLFLSPVLALGLVAEWLRSRRRPDALALALVAFVAVLCGYAHFGIPEGLARVTGLGRIPGQRVAPALLFAEVLLLARWLGPAASPARGARRAARGLHASIALGWLACVAAAGGRIRESLPQLTWGWILALAALNGALAFLVLGRWRPTLLCALMAAGLGATSLDFNPLVRGGSSYLRENDLSQTLLRIDREHDGRTTWLVYDGAPLPNLLPSLGLHVLNGEQAPPQLDLWRRIDPSPEAFRIYNRYASVAFRWPPRESGERLRLSNHSNYTWYVDPADPLLLALGVTHILVGPGRQGAMRDYVPIARSGDRLLFELPLVRARMDAAPRPR